MNTKIMTQRLGVGELLVQGWQLYRANLKNIFLIVLCVYIPINIIISFFPLDDFVNKYGEVRGLQLHDNLYRILNFYIGVIATLGIAWTIENSLHRIAMPWQDALKYGGSKWGTAVITSLLQAVILMGLFLLLIIPGVIWSVYYTFWIYVVALRRLSGKAALDYSKRLVQGQWWRVLAISIVIWILDILIGLVISFPLGLLPINPFFEMIANTITNLIDSYFIVVTIVFFLNNDYGLNPVQVEQTVLPVAITEAQME